MNVPDQSEEVPGRLGPVNPLHRLHTRLILLALVAVVAVGLGAGVAYAKTRAAPIGTGVVVIETNLAYANGAAAGTGMVLTSSGEILTNNHVIRGATSIKVVIPGTGRSYTAKVVGYDVTDDVAVIQASGASNLKTISTANSSSVKVGQSVTATGNANGTGTLTSATGTVTGVGQAITVSDDSGGTEHLTGLIETSAALQPGDSGGPLFNAAGKVIGMDTAASVNGGYGYRQMSSTDGYAIPISTALSIAGQIEDGKSSATVHVGGTAFLGISVSANGYGYGYSSGAVVSGVVSGGAAANAGLEAGDTITSLDGHAVTSATGISSIVLTEKPGAKVSVTYVDGSSGATQTTTLTLASGPPQ